MKKRSTQPGKTTPSERVPQVSDHPFTVLEILYCAVHDLVYNTRPPYPLTILFLLKRENACPTIALS